MGKENSILAKYYEVDICNVNVTTQIECQGYGMSENDVAVPVAYITIYNSLPPERRRKKMKKKNLGKVYAITRFHYGGEMEDYYIQERICGGGVFFSFQKAKKIMNKLAEEEISNEEIDGEPGRPYIEIERQNNYIMLNPVYHTGYTIYKIKEWIIK